MSWGDWVEAMTPNRSNTIARGMGSSRAGRSARACTSLTGAARRSLEQAVGQRRHNVRVTTTGKDKGPHPRAGARGAGGARRRGRGSPALATERREHLVKLAAELFAEKGFQATTVRNIADEAGILSGSLYHHFDSKESIVDEILSGFFTEIMAAYQAVVDQNDDPRDTIAGLVRVAFGTLEPHRAAITVMQNDW